MEAKLFEMTYYFLGHQKGDTTVPSSLIKEESLSKESELLGSSDIHQNEVNFARETCGYPKDTFISLIPTHFQKLSS